MKTILIVLGVIVAVVVVILYSFLIAIIIRKGFFGRDTTSPEEDIEQLDYLKKFYEREGKRNNGIH